MPNSLTLLFQCIFTNLQSCISVTWSNCKKLLLACFKHYDGWTPIKHFLNRENDKGQITIPLTIVWCYLFFSPPSKRVNALFCGFLALFAFFLPCTCCSLPPGVAIFKWTVVEDCMSGLEMVNRTHVGNTSADTKLTKLNMLDWSWFKDCLNLVRFCNWRFTHKSMLYLLKLLDLWWKIFLVRVSCQLLSVSDHFWESELTGLDYGNQEYLHFVVTCRVRVFDTGRYIRDNIIVCNSMILRKGLVCWYSSALLLVAQCLPLR